MAIAILNHRVKNYATWKSLFDTDKQRRDSMGITEITVGQKAGDPGMAYMIWEVKDPSIFDAMMADKELQKVMAEAGVISAPELTIIE